MPLKKSVTVAGHRTSVSLESEFWDALQSLAAADGISTAQLIAQIDDHRKSENLSAALRIHILKDLQDRLLKATIR